MVINVMLQHAGGRKDTTILTLVIRIKCKPNKNSLVSNISRKVEKKKHIFELACVQNKSKRLRSASDELLEDFLFIPIHMRCCNRHMYYRSLFLLIGVVSVVKYGDVQSLVLLLIPVYLLMD